MKKAVLSGILALIFSTIGFASIASSEDLFNENSLLYKGISKYKEGNYTGCMQDMLQVVEEDPSDALAHYYLAITYVKIGYLDKAKAEYNMVNSLGTSSQLSSYSSIGIKCIDEPEKCPSRGTKEAVQTVMSTTEQIPDEVQDMIKQQKLNNLKNMINSGDKIDPKKINEFEIFDDEDRSDIPTNEQVANALKILEKAGYNNVNNTLNPVYPNSDAMQMNMLMSSVQGSQNYNSSNQMNNLMPLLMMQSNGKNVNPEILQTMIMGSMMPSMYSGFENKTNN